MWVVIVWVANFLLCFGSLWGNAYAHPMCLNLADTSICEGVKIQVPTYPNLYKNINDLELFLAHSLNFTSIDTISAKCNSSLFLGLLAIPSCKQYRCSQIAQELITLGLDRKRPTNLYSHCASDPQVYTSCQSVCFDAVKEGNDYIDQNCKGEDDAKRRLWAPASSCESYPFIDCNMFSTEEDMFSHAPGPWDAPILKSSWITIALWLSLAIIL